MMAFFLPICIPVFLAGITANGQTTKTTSLVFHTSLNPWKSASRRCRDLDPSGRLVTVDTPAKADLLKRLRYRQPWEELITGDYWVGLHNTDPASDRYVWDGVCERLGAWTDWANGQPSHSALANCVRGGSINDQWKLAPCTENAPFICEKVTDDNCFFELVKMSTIPDVSSFPGMSVEISKVLKNDTFCDVLCLSAFYNSRECWLWLTDGDYCVLYMSDTTILVTEETPKTYSTFVKVCHTASVITSVISYSPSEVDPSPNDCPVDTTTTKTTQEFILAEAVQTDTKTETSAMTTSASTTTAKRRVVAAICECFCESNTVALPAPTLSPKEKQEFVIHIIESLTLNKSEISSVRRKFISAQDTRPSARRMGLLGISMMSLVFGGILIFDLNGLLRDFKTMIHNIRSGLGCPANAENYKKKGEENDNAA